MIALFALRRTSPTDCVLCATFGVDFAAGAVVLVSFLPAADVFPNRISRRLRFIALHIIWVSRSPDAPTIPPTATRRISPMAIPAIEPATPLSELSSDMVMGMSAPPTRIAKAYPKIELNTTASRMINHGSVYVAPELSAYDNTTATREPIIIDMVMAS